MRKIIFVLLLFCPQYFLGQCLSDSPMYKGFYNWLFGLYGEERRYFLWLDWKKEVKYDTTALLGCSNTDYKIFIDKDSLERKRKEYLEYNLIFNEVEYKATLRTYDKDAFVSYYQGCGGGQEYSTPRYLNHGYDTEEHLAIPSSKYKYVTTLSLAGHSPFNKRGKGLTLRSEAAKNIFIL